MKEVTIDGVTYVQKQEVPTMNDMRYVLIRGDRSGVFVGFLEKKDGQEVTLKHVTRLWGWSGALACCQLASIGIDNPAECNFERSSEITILDAIEVHPVTVSAKKSFETVKDFEK